MFCVSHKQLIFKECIEVLNTFVEIVIVVGETFVYVIYNDLIMVFLKTRKITKLYRGVLARGSSVKENSLTVR